MELFIQKYFEEKNKRLKKCFYVKSLLCLPSAKQDSFQYPPEFRLLPLTVLTESKPISLK